MFITIPPAFLAQIATDSDRVPTLYYSKNFLVRTFFWFRLRLIHVALRRVQKRWETALDFGGGGGVFLPTLSSLFRQVTCVDLETVESEQVLSEFKLPNVKLVKADIGTLQNPERYDAIVAADVLEHFKDLTLPVRVLRSWVKPDGFLYVSLPSENYLYVFLRKVFGVEKPWDHYHTASEVEAYLSTHGFRPVLQLYHPLYFKILVLFHISVWAPTPD